MLSNFSKRALVGAMFSLAGTNVNAASITLDFDYLATNGKGDFAQFGATKVGSITLTDLTDLALGDGFTGVRASISLGNLNQFASPTALNPPAIFISSFELNFKDTGVLTPDAVSPSWRYVSGLNLNLARNGGPIEFAEDGAINGWGTIADDPSFEQEFNYVAGQFTNGVSSTMDLLNGEGGYDGFSVAQLLANPVHNIDSSLPDAYAWIKVRSLNQAIANGDTGQWWGAPVSNANGGRLNVLAIAVPEPETIPLFMLGIGVALIARRYRKISR
jgi:PEP-CTERM motif